ncbi:MAG: tetratricopeptide repeat protein [Planctomycetota bacterium]|jgi:tetratricopeptide (TPR) repeat protein
MSPRLAGVACAASALLLSGVLGCTKPAGDAPQNPKPTETPAPAAEPAADPSGPTIARKGSKGPTERPSAPAGKLGPEGPATARSTGPTIYLRNLASRLGAAKARVELDSAGVADHVRYADALLEQSHLDGDLGKVRTAVAQLEAAAKLAPKDPKLMTQRAAALTRMHDFAAARGLLESALALAPDDGATKLALSDVLRNLGEYAAAAKMEAGVEPKGHEALARHAIRHFEAGRIDEADLWLRRAHGAYSDVHPITLAWLDLQRGLLRLRTGRYPEAHTFFKAAYDRLPDYYLVAEHLAETESLLGNHARALELYDRVIETTRLPEFIGARAGVLAETGDKAGAEAALKATDARWRALLEQHPKAWASHAVGFWLEDRVDPKAARKWADFNLTVRKDAGSLLTAARAAAAAGDLDAARTHLAAAEPNAIETDEAWLDRADVLLALGETEKAKAAAAKALARNPKAEVPAELR